LFEYRESKRAIIKSLYIKGLSGKGWREYGESMYRSLEGLKVEGLKFQVNILGNNGSFVL